MLIYFTIYFNIKHRIGKTMVFCRFSLVNQSNSIVVSVPHPRNLRTWLRWMTRLDSNICKCPSRFPKKIVTHKKMIRVINGFIYHTIGGEKTISITVLITITDLKQTCWLIFIIPVRSVSKWWNKSTDRMSSPIPSPWCPTFGGIQHHEEKHQPCLGETRHKPGDPGPSSARLVKKRIARFWGSHKRESLT